MGLEIGALSPEEIAVSITAELVAVRRNAATAAHKKLNTKRTLHQFSKRASAEREHMLAAVILSGGASSRMGSPKALLPYQGGRSSNTCWK